MMIKRASLLFLLVLGQASAVSPTGAEFSELVSIEKTAEAADTALLSGGFADGIRGYTSCVSRAGALLSANPGLKDEVVKGVTEPNTVGQLQAYCQQILSQYGTLSDPADPKLGDDLDACSEAAEDDFRMVNDARRYQQCATRIKNAVQKYPVLSGFKFTGGILLPELARKYQARADQAATTQKAEAGATVLKAQPYKDGYDKAQAQFQAARNRPSNSGGAVLKKYTQLKIAVDAFGTLKSGMLSFNRPELLSGKLGNTTVGGLITQINASEAQAQAALTAITAQANKAALQQFNQIKATLPKLIGGDRLNVYRRFGVPNSWTNQGFVLDSGDGVAAAKSIAAADRWNYAEDSRGCHYYYSFNRNSVTNIDKPLGCVQGR
ncbi:hypothetical protein [Deinococcus altitudinis]|uniref:hypothetical protein n=1 Tax=Deinococcus altitudinis TaxID=468914 RepID=UPI0038927554